MTSYKQPERFKPSEEEVTEELGKMQEPGQVEELEEVEEVQQGILLS